jgi:hypothetical protein
LRQSLSQFIEFVVHRVDSFGFVFSLRRICERIAMRPASRSNPPAEDARNAILIRCGEGGYEAFP